MLHLRFNLSFEDLYARDGLARVDAAFLKFLGEADTGLRDTLLAARESAAGRKGRVRAPDRARAAPGGLPRAAVRHRGRGAGARGAAPRTRPALLGETAVRAAARPAQGEARRRYSGRIRLFHRTRIRQANHGLAEGRGGERRPARAGGALRGLGHDDACGQGEAPARSAVQDSAQARLHAPDPGAHGTAPSQRLPAHRRRHRPRWRAGRGELLHLVPRAGQGFLLQGTQGEGASRRFQEDRVRRAARRLPARGKDFRVPPGEGARRAAGGARPHRGGQPDGRRHGAPHLQRLHEVLHLPEAGAGQHPAGRDAHVEGRAGAALGLRDLLAAHALEPVQPAPALSQAAERPQGAGGGSRARPASPWRTT